MHTKKLFAPFLVFVAAMLWATDAPLRVNVTKDLPSTFIVFIEHAFSLIILIPFLIKAISKLKTQTFKTWLVLIGIGAGSSALALILFTESFHYLNPSAAILLQKLQPFIAIILAHLFLKEKYGKWFWYLASLAVLGGYLISFPSLVPKVFAGEVWDPKFIGILLAAGAALLWALGTILGRVALKNFTWQEVTALRFLFGFIFLAIWNTLDGTLTTVGDVTRLDWLYLLIMSLVSGAVGLLLYYRGLQDTKASIATIAELGFVVSAVLVNFIFIDAKLLPLQIVGMIIVLIAVLSLAKRQEKI